MKCYDRQGAALGSFRFPNDGDPPLAGFSDGLASLKFGDKWGFINGKMEQAIAPSFDDVRTFSNGAAAVRLGEVWGFVDKTGKMIVAPKYDEVHPFYDGIAAVRAGQKCYLIYKSGKPPVLVEGEWGSESKMHEGLIAARARQRGRLPKGFLCETCGELLNGHSFGDACPRCGENIGRILWGFVDSSGTFQIDPAFSDCRSFSDGVAAAAPAGESGLWGFIDKHGRFTIEPKYAGVETGFSDGLCAVTIPGAEERGVDRAEIYNSYIDRQGTIVWHANISKEAEGNRSLGNKASNRK